MAVDGRGDGDRLTRRVFLGATAVGAAGLMAGCSRDGGASAEPTVEGSVVTRWDTDPWSLGSYSALPAGTSWRARQTLSEAVLADQVVFAGEYTATDFPSTVHGAYRSGQRAGQLLHQRSAGAGAVAVIGAGIAGLAAADYLTNAGWQVEVVEARDRVGGRVYTDRSLGVPVERGASWIHGVTGNPMVRVVKAAGLDLEPTNFDDARAHTYATGRTAPGVGTAIDELWRVVEPAESKRPVAADSVADVLAAAGWTADTPQRQLAEMTELIMEFGVDLPRLGAQALWEGDYPRGGDSMVVGGFDAVPQMMASQMSVRLNTPVRRVTTGDEVVLDTDSGQMTVDAAVVAVPLALVQAGTPGLELPPMVAQAVAGLITGNLEKVFLAFPEVWWPDAQVLQVMSAPQQRWSEWYPLDQITGRPIAMGLSGGSSALARAADDAELAREAAGTLWEAYR